MVETFCRGNEDPGGRSPKATLTQTVCGPGPCVGPPELWVPNLCKRTDLSAKLSKFFIECSRNTSCYCFVARRQVSRQKDLGESHGSRTPQASWPRGRTGRRRKVPETDSMWQGTLAPPAQQECPVHPFPYHRGYLELDPGLLLHTITIRDFKVVCALPYSPSPTPGLRAHAAQPLC